MLRKLLMAAVLVSSLTAPSAARASDPVNVLGGDWYGRVADRTKNWDETWVIREVGLGKWAVNGHYWERSPKKPTGYRFAGENVSFDATTGEIKFMQKFASKPKDWADTCYIKGTVEGTTITFRSYKDATFSTAWPGVSTLSFIRR